jgi:hypothetical protein
MNPALNAEPLSTSGFLLFPLKGGKREKQDPAGFPNGGKSWEKQEKQRPSSHMGTLFSEGKAEAKNALFYGRFQGLVFPAPGKAENGPECALRQPPFRLRLFMGKRPAAGYSIHHSLEGKCVFRGLFGEFGGQKYPELSPDYSELSRS